MNSILCGKNIKSKLFFSNLFLLVSVDRYIVSTLFIARLYTNLNYKKLTMCRYCSQIRGRLSFFYYHIEALFALFKPLGVNQLYPVDKSMNTWVRHLQLLSLTYRTHHLSPFSWPTPPFSNFPHSRTSKRTRQRCSDYQILILFLSCPW